MAKHLQCMGLFIGMGLILLPSLQASPWFWPSQTRSSPSVVTISIGNRVNVNTSSTDWGTSIQDLTFNLSRWNGNLTFGKNDTEIFITQGNDGATNIHIDFGSVSHHRKSSTTNRTASSNSTHTTSRRKRAIFGLPTLPSIPIPTLNGTLALLNGNFNPLPNAITNLANIGRTFVQPWQFLQTFLSRRLPMLVLDTAVSFLSQLYASTAKRMVDTGVNALGETMDALSSVVNTGLNSIEEQVVSGIGNITRSFKQLTPSGQDCVGQVPDDAAAPVAAKATGCVRDRWNELEGIVNQFLIAINDTEAAYGGWLRSLDGCNARNFAGLNDSALESAQLSCYVQTIANSVGKMVALPIQWANLAAKVSSAMANFQPQVGLCVAGVGVEVASVSANIGVRVGLCQVMQVFNIT